MELYKKQSDFPFLEEYKKHFKVTGETIFAYNGKIYTNEKLLPPDILMHELIHLKRQNKIGADKWVKRYLEDDQFRLNEEVIAYKAQLDFYKDRNEKNLCRLKCVRALSENYGNIIEPLEAFKLLK